MAKSFKLEELELRSTDTLDIVEDKAELAVKLAEFREKYPEIVQLNLARMKKAA